MGIFTRAWAVWRRQSRHFVGEDLQGNRYFEIPSLRTDLPRAIRRVEYGEVSHDVVRNANKARQLPVQWTSWLSHTRPDPPTLEELQKDLLRRQRLQHNVQLIEARDREERERLALEQSETLRLAPGDERAAAAAQSTNYEWPPAPVREEPKPVEDPWEKARKEAGPEQPSAWKPQARRK